MQARIRDVSKALSLLGLVITLAACGDTGMPFEPETGPRFSASSAACPMATVELDLARAINQARAANGLTPVEIDMRLDASATAHSQLMADESQVSTQLPGEPSPVERMAAQGYPSPLGEAVIGELSTTAPSQIVQFWLQGTERSLLLSPSARHVGVSVVQGTFIVFWTADFGAASEPAQSGECSLNAGTNTPPIAAFTAPAQSVEGAAVAFDATASHDPDGDPLTYSWDFGDGKFGSGAIPMHIYNDDGEYTVTLTVTDGRGGTASTSQMVSVANGAPMITSFSGPPNPSEPGSSVSVAGTFTDGGVSDTHTVEITWGDGTTSQAAVTGTSMKSFSASHSFAAGGTFVVTATVTDNDGASANRSVSVVVTEEVGEQNVMVVGVGSIRDSDDRSMRQQKRPDKTTFRFLGVNRHGALEGSATLHLPHGAKLFQSASTRKLVVDENSIVMEGEGVLRGRNGYEFRINAYAGPDGDRVRLKIWESATGSVIYDSQPDEPDDAEPSSGVNGNIRIIRFR